PRSNHSRWLAGFTNTRHQATPQACNGATGLGL
ncbi:uncharacterized protein METZ01_LOCUS380242, partial [marine metagenome]